MKVIDVAEFYADQGGGVKTYINQKLRAGAALQRGVRCEARTRRVEIRLGADARSRRGPFVATTTVAGEGAGQEDGPSLFFALVGQRCGLTPVVRTHARCSEP